MAKSQNAKKMKNKKQSDTNRVALRFCSVVERATCKTQLSQAGRAARDRGGDETLPETEAESSERGESESSKKESKTGTQL